MLLLAAAIAGAACTTQRPTESTSRDDLQAGESPYPVDPQVHVRDRSNDARDPGSIRAAVSNPVAYARYAASLLGDAPVTAEPSEIAAVVAARASASGIAPRKALAYFQRVATEAQRRAHATRVAEHARGVVATAPLSTLASRVADAEVQRDACVADGDSERACCEALAIPWFFSDAWPKLDEAARTTLSARADRLYDALAAEAASRPQLFEHQGIKAWLAACAPAVDGLPATLDGVRARWGDYRSGADWDVELHPISMAKLAPRRIYRRSDAPVSIADSLGEDCAIRETELVAVHASGVVAFATYFPDGRRQLHGLFPLRRDADAVKYSPDSCMGCHYRLDSREFDVRVPSYRALGLTLRTAGREPAWVDGSACVAPGDRVVWHERP